MEQDIRSIFMSEDRQRRAEVYEKSGVWYVNLIVGEQLVEARPMVSRWSCAQPKICRRCS